jgi:hypothetical protein
MVLTSYILPIEENIILLEQNKTHKIATKNLSFLEIKEGILLVQHSRWSLNYYEREGILELRIGGHWYTMRERGSIQTTLFAAYSCCGGCPLSVIWVEKRENLERENAFKKYLVLTVYDKILMSLLSNG